MTIEKSKVIFCNHVGCHEHLVYSIESSDEAVLIDSIIFNWTRYFELSWCPKHSKGGD